MISLVELCTLFALNSGMTISNQADMIFFPNKETAKLGENDTALALVKAERKRQDFFLILSQLQNLIKDVQLHRGMCLSLLAGSSAFTERIEPLQHTLEKRLYMLESYARETGDILSRQDKENLAQAWQTVRHDWHLDQPLDNFELHNHFIDQLLNMIHRLSRHHAIPIEQHPSATSEEHDTPDSFVVIEVLEFISKHMPLMLENLAKIRGLASHAATLGVVEYEQDRKLRYWVRSAKEKNEQLRHQAKRLESITAHNPLPMLSKIGDYELKVLRFFNVIENDILGGRTMATSGDELFAMATAIIDPYSYIIEAGWQWIRAYHNAELERWFQQ